MWGEGIFLISFLFFLVLQPEILFFVMETQTLEMDIKRNTFYSTKQYLYKSTTSCLEGRYGQLKWIIYGCSFSNACRGRKRKNSIERWSRAKEIKLKIKKQWRLHPSQNEKKNRRVAREAVSNAVRREKPELDLELILRLRKQENIKCR